jgi:hypothetical protein
MGCGDGALTGSRWLEPEALRGPGLNPSRGRGDMAATKRPRVGVTERNEALRMERAAKLGVIPIQVLSLGCFETNDKTAY